MTSLVRGIAATIVLAGFTGSSQAQAPAPAPPGAGRPPVEIRIDLNPLVSCHFFLKTWAGPGDKPAAGQTVDLGSEASAYATAKQAIKDPALWRWFEDLVVAGPDPGSVRQAAKDLPPSLGSPSNRTAVDMLVEALDSAYPKFMSGYWPDQTVGMNRLMIPARRRLAKASGRLEQTLLDKMGFTPIDAPITVLMVVRAGPVSSWGKTASGYYTVIGAYIQSVDSFVETSIHEATHLIDAVQSASRSWVLKDLRQALPKDAPPEAIDAFIHGLIAFNAGELVKRYMDTSYRPVGIRGPSSKDDFGPYVPAYEAAWNPWLDGTKSRQETLDKLVAGFKAAIAAKPPAPAKKS